MGCGCGKRGALDCVAILDVGTASVGLFSRRVPVCRSSQTRNASEAASLYSKGICSVHHTGLPKQCVEEAGCAALLMRVARRCCIMISRFSFKLSSLKL